MALYHTAKGSVDYTVVGNPTIVDGVVSGFSSSNYLQIDSNFSPSNNIWEAVIKINLTNATTTQTIINGKPLGGIAAPFGISFRSNGKLRLYLFINGESSLRNIGESTHTFSTGTLYIKLQFTGAKYILSTSQDKNSWTEEISYTSTTQVKQAGVSKLCFGVEWNTSSAEPFLGSIDLNETYITVNGQPWFGVCPIEVKKHQIMGPVGYTVVGSPTITDGVASGFSESNYLTLPYLPSTFEGQICFTTGSSISPFQDILIARPLFNIEINNINGVGSYNWGVSADYTTIIPQSDLEANTKYIVKFSYEYNTLSFSYSKNGGSWSTPVTKSTTQVQSSDTIIGKHSTSTGRQFQGSIDFNQTYIKVNGKLWFWQPADTKYIVKDGKLVWADPRIALSGPVNYTVVGTPTITDGIASGFSTSDYLISTSEYPNNITSFVKQVRFTTPSSWTSEFYADPLIGSANYDRIMIRENSLCRFTTGGQTVKDYILSYELAVSTTYTVNFTYSGTTLTGTLFDANGNSIYTQNYELEFTYAPNTAPRIGSNTVGGTMWYSRCQIDLKNTYIQINGQLWFYGKNYATQNIAPVPAGYTFGTTTTPSIGYVDMRTQQFTAAPQGATIGRDEE